VEYRTTKNHLTRHMEIAKVSWKTYQDAIPKGLQRHARHALFITWDESEGTGNAPIGLIALSPFAKPGYAGNVSYTHSSLVRTVQDVFALRPFMRDAARATSLDDLFVSYP
jgi:hypothetical protein